MSGVTVPLPAPETLSVSVRVVEGETATHEGATVWFASMINANGLVGLRATPSTVQATSFMLVPLAVPRTVTAVPVG